MADATLAQARNRVLQKLSVLERGETAEAEDSALIESIIASVNEELRDLEICYWSDAAFPQAILEAFADYVACFAVGDYPSQKNQQRYGQPQSKVMYRQDLARLCSSRERIDKPTKAVYY
jgi:hypothetical protein